MFELLMLDIRSEFYDKISMILFDFVSSKCLLRAKVGEFFACDGQGSLKTVGIERFGIHNGQMVALAFSKHFVEVYETCSMVHG